MMRILVLTLFVASGIWASDYALGFGGIGDDSGNEVVVTDDGSAFVACSLYTVTSGYHASVLAKISPSGTIEWIKALGELNDSASCTHRIRIAPSPVEDAIYVVGYYSEFPVQGVKVYKLNKQGNALWSVWIYNDKTSFYYARFPSLTVTADGDPVVMWSTSRPGEENYDLLFARMSKTDGSLVWYRVYDLVSDDGYQDWTVPYLIGDGLCLPDSLLLFDALFPLSYTHTGILYLDPVSGDIADSRLTNIRNRYLLDVDSTSDNGIVSLWLAYGSPQTGSPETLFVAKNDINWSPVWTKVRLGPDTVYGAYYSKPYMSISSTPDNGCVVVGSHSDTVYTSYTLASKFTSTGDVVWHKTYSTRTSHAPEFFTSVDVNPEGDIYLTGRMNLLSNDDCFFARIAPDGSTCIGADTSLTVTDVPPIQFTLCSMHEVTSSYNGHIVFSSLTPVLSDVSSYLDTTICQSTEKRETGQEHCADLEFKSVGKSLYLSLPQQGEISLELYDGTGRLVQVVYRGPLEAGQHRFTPVIDNKGIYFALLSYKGGIYTRKMVK